MKKILLFLLTATVFMSSQAMELDYSNNHKIAASLRLGMSVFPSFEAELGVEYRPLRYVGANIGMMYSNSWNSKTTPIGIVPETQNMVWEIKGTKDIDYHFVAKAGLQLTTPAIMLSKNEMGLSLRVSPGILVPIPTNKSVTINNFQIVKQEIDEDIDIETESDKLKDEIELKFVSSEEHKNTGAKFCYWYVRSELVLEFEEQWEFAVGYTYSNLDIYGGSRSLKVYDTQLVAGEKKPQHTFSLGLTFKF